jgi:hypothetical protein
MFRKQIIGTTLVCWFFSLIPFGGTMRRSFPILLILFAITSPLSGQKTAHEDTTGDVMKVVNRLFDSMRTRDTSSVRGVFIPDGRLISTALRNGQPTTRILTLDDFVKLVNETKEPYRERMFDPEVRIYGDMATVEGWYDFHVGERLTNCGVNAFQLVRTSGGWKIAHIASTIQTTGCERQSKEQEKL